MCLEATWCLLSVSHLSFFQGQDGRKVEEAFCVICERRGKMPPSGQCVWTGQSVCVCGQGFTQQQEPIRQSEPSP